MKAVIFDQHGDVDVLQYRAVPTPEPSHAQVLVRLHAAALNRADILVRQGAAHFNTPLPMILGIEGAGVVAQLGEGVEGVSVGERVVIDSHFNCGRCRYCRMGRENLCLDYRVPGEHINGTYAEYIAVPAENVIAMPDTISFEQAAATPVAFQTAWHLLITRGGLRAGETILIVGAGGGVASAGVQIAHMAGARVIATTGSAEKAKRLREIGADEIINYRETSDFDRVVLELTAGVGVDVVQDNVGQATFEKCLNSLAKGGRFLGVGSHTGTQIQTRLWQIYSRELQIIGSHQGTHAELRTVLALVWSGRLRPIVAETFPLAEARAAHQHMVSGERFGKVVLTIGK
ncbi:MAG: alcohol dehydrogenase catalytic domain-containing protein [Chloroflexota bacterium]